MKRIQKFLITVLIFLSFNVWDVYAYSIETLNNSSDFQEISQMEEEIFRWAQGALESENQNADLQIEYSRAVKIYIDTNIFENEELTPKILQTILNGAVYIWEVPVEVSENKYVIVTVSRSLPIDEELQQELLENGTYTQKELEIELEKTGNWTIARASYDETKSDYIGRLESALSESYNEADSDVVYLLGGTPKIRLPFGVIFKDDECNIIKLNDEEGIYRFEQMKDIVNKIPKEDTMSEDIVVVKNKYSWYIIFLSIAGLFAGIFIFVKLIQKN